jgi:hypothetical protein
LPRAVLAPAYSRSMPNPFSPSAAGVTGDIPVMPGLPKSSTPQTGALFPGQVGTAWSSKKTDQSEVFQQTTLQVGYGRKLPRSMLVNPTSRGAVGFDGGMDAGTGIPNHLMRG